MVIGPCLPRNRVAYSAAVRASALPMDSHTPVTHFRRTQSGVGMVAYYWEMESCDGHRSKKEAQRAEQCH